MGWYLYKRNDRSQKETKRIAQTRSYEKMGPGPRDGSVGIRRNRASDGTGRMFKLLAVSFTAEQDAGGACVSDLA